MAKIAVVTDSAACVPAALRQALDICEIPFELTWDGVTYQDDAAFNPAEFYGRFRREPTAHPTTSQPSLGAFATLYEQLGHTHDAIVSIHVSGEMSGTVGTARLAAEQIQDVPIRIVDSRTATIAEGFIVLAAARAAAAGAELEQVVEAAEQVSQKVDFFATLKSLEYIHRGGRLGDAARVLSSQLQISPILNLKNGRVSVVCLARTWKSALQRILELTLERVQGRQRVHASVFHADAQAEAERLRDRLLGLVPCVEFYVTAFTPVMGAHTGPDVVGLAFYADD
jgi:DegV family protein with EDD domain